MTKKNLQKGVTLYNIIYILHTEERDKIKINDKNTNQIIKY